MWVYTNFWVLCESFYGEFIEPDTERMWVHTNFFECYVRIYMMNL
jgi:hypothetical protein